jgi:predicted  nucleic acid-binding Zn-ribbon protein
VSKQPFRVKHYAHGKYKFLVRGKVLGKWRRRYFATEAEAVAFSEQQNAHAQQGNGEESTKSNGAMEAMDLRSPRFAEWPQAERTGSARDFSKLAFPAYLGPQIERYLGDSWCMHLPFAYDLMRELAPKVFVELGVKQGESYFSFCQSAAENKINVRCYGVDSWRGDVQTGRLDPEIQHEVTEYNWRYSSFSELKPMLFAEALRDFPDGTIDLLHIDGTHTYADVKTDFESWLPKLSPKGIILFHDVMLRDHGFGVWKLWEEITREHHSFLFEFGFGLGVWKKQPVSASDPSFIRGLLGASKAERRDINAYYANAAVALALWHSLQKQSDGENQIARLETEAGETSQQLAEFRTELEEKSKQVAQLQRDLGESSRRVARESDRQSQLIEQFKHQLDAANDRLARAGDELLDARWEALTLRGASLRNSDSAETPSVRVLELENRVETTTSERDHLRTMLASLQNDLDQERLREHTKQGELRATQDQLKVVQEQLDTAQCQLRALTKELQSEQKQMDRLRSSISHKLILPFGKSQRKLQQLTTSRRNDN